MVKGLRPPLAPCNALAPYIWWTNGPFDPIVRCALVDAPWGNEASVTATCSVGGKNAYHASVYHGRSGSLRGGSVSHRDQRDSQSRRLARVSGRGNRGSRGVEPGRLRHPRPEVLPQGRCTGVPGAGRRRRLAVLAVAPYRRQVGAGESARSSTSGRRN